MRPAFPGRTVESQVSFVHQHCGLKCRMCRNSAEVDGCDPAKLPIDNLKFGRIRHDRMVNPTCPSCHVKTSESIRSWIVADTYQPQEINWSGMVITETRRRA